MAAARQCACLALLHHARNGSARSKARSSAHRSPFVVFLGPDKQNETKRNKPPDRAMQPLRSRSLLPRKRECAAARAALRRGAPPAARRRPGLRPAAGRGAGGPLLLGRLPCAFSCGGGARLVCRLGCRPRGAGDPAARGRFPGLGRPLQPARAAEQPQRSGPVRARSGRRGRRGGRLRRVALRRLAGPRAGGPFDSRRGCCGC